MSKAEFRIPYELTKTQSANSLSSFYCNTRPFFRFIRRYAIDAINE